MSRRGALLALSTALLASGCASADLAVPAVFDATGRPVAAATLLARLRGARFVLLGEVHDNPLHHAARAALLHDLLADGRPTRVVFEQIDRGHSAAIAALPAAQARDVDAVIAAGRLDKKGWAWPLHRPLFETALAGGASIVGGNLSRAEATPLVRGGAARLPVELRRWFDSDGNAARWSAAQEDSLRREVDDGHCHALPPAMLGPMALAQRARDAALADAMLAAPTGTRVVLIAGNGHVRRDLGVPHYLRAAGVAAAAIVAVGYLERPLAEDGPPYDAVVPTDAVKRDDPCAAFKAPPSSEHRGTGSAGTLVLPAGKHAGWPSQAENSPQGLFFVRARPP